MTPHRASPPALRSRRRPGCSGSLLLGASSLLLGACADLGTTRHNEFVATLRAEQAAAAQPAPVAPRAPAPQAPPVPRVEAPTAPTEARFDLVVNGANVRDVFLSMVADTRYSMLMHPEVSGTISVTLRAVTVREALESIRDVYGFDFRVDGRRITVYPPTLQTRIFTVNYLTSQRKGRSEMRVSGGGMPVSTTGGSGTSSGTGNTGGTPNPTPGSVNGAPDGTQITTTSSSDFWVETVEALRGLLSKGEGRAVMASPQAGTIAVRAMPDELRHVEQFLRASRLAIERQVMLEAKIIEVELRDGYQSGIDWSLLRSRGAIGQTSGLSGNALVSNPNGLPTLPEAVGSLLVDSVAMPLAATLRRVRPRQAAGQLQAPGSPCGARRIQLQAPGILPLLRRPAHVADRCAPGRPRHPARAGAAMGAVAADPAARAAGRAAGTGHAGAAGGAARGHATSAAAGGAQG
jgi:MSHA biogenesis protein MshL